MLIKNFLSFDISKKKIGVAIGQNLTKTASPLLPINFFFKNKKIGLNKIKNLIIKWNPKKIIIGLPLNMDGTMQNTSLEAINFNKLINKKFYIKTVLYDERLSTYEAKKKKIINISYIDSIAAVIILEDWLNNKYT